MTKMEFKVQNPFYFWYGLSKVQNEYEYTQAYRLLQLHLINGLNKSGKHNTRVIIGTAFHAMGEERLFEMLEDPVNYAWMVDLVEKGMPLSTSKDFILNELATYFVREILGGLSLRKCLKWAKNRGLTYKGEWTPVKWYQVRKGRMGTYLNQTESMVYNINGNEVDDLHSFLRAANATYAFIKAAKKQFVWTT